MSIRSNGLGRYHTYGNDNVISMSDNLQHLLQRNGLDAFMRQDSGGNITLVVRGNRGFAYSPTKEYKITPQQMAVLMKGGRESFDKKAYNTFNDIISKDFVPPEAYVVACNTGIGANGMNMRTSVIMGWGGVPISRGPFGFTRLESQRPDGRRLPGESAAMRELPDGSYVPTAGYVWKGNLRSTPNLEAAKNIEVKSVEPAAPRPAKRPEPGQARPLSTLAKSAGNDTWPMLQEVFDSHGIVIKDKGGEKTLVIKALNARKNVEYTLTDDEYAKLTANGWRGKGDKSLSSRLDLINAKIGEDFEQKITVDMLNTKDYVDLTFTPEAKAVYEKDFIAYEQAQQMKELKEKAITAAKQEIDAERFRISSDPNAIDGREISHILQGKAFFNNVDNGRQVVVGEIRVDDKYQSLTQDYDMKATSLEKITKEIAELQSKKASEVAEKISQLTQQRNENVSDIYRLEKDIEAMKKTSDPYKDEKIKQMEEQRKECQIRKDEYNKELGKYMAMVDTEAQKEIKHLTELQSRLENDIDLLKKDIQKYEKGDIANRYVMSALVNGEWKEKSLTEKEYQKFLNYDDKHRIENFVKHFDNLKIDNGVDNSLELQVYNLKDAQNGVSVVAEAAEKANIQHALSSSVNAAILSQLNEKKGFYADGKGGRERQVSEISVAEVTQQDLKQVIEDLKQQNTRESRQQLKEIADKTENGKKTMHIMTAVVDGKSITKAISSKDFNQFLKTDDMNRMKMAARLFSEFDIKTRPEFKVSTGKVLAGVLGAITGVGIAALDMSEGYNRGRMPIMPERRPGPPPALMASAIFETIMEEKTQQNVSQEINNGRGL